MCFAATTLAVFVGSIFAMHAEGHIRDVVAMVKSKSVMMNCDAHAGQDASAKINKEYKFYIYI